MGNNSHEEEVHAKTTNQKRKACFRKSTPTTLERLKKEVLITMEKENLLTPFLRMKKGTTRRDISKYCDYHKDHSHDTEECIHLKEKINDLIR